jgi:hypothetical protein
VPIAVGSASRWIRDEERAADHTRLIVVLEVPGP